MADEAARSLDAALASLKQAMDTREAQEPITPAQPPSPKPSAEIVQLPLWPDAAPGMPNPLSAQRCSLPSKQRQTMV